MPDTVYIGVRVPTDQAADLIRLAKRSDRTVSAEVRRAIRRHLAAQEEASATADQPRPDGGTMRRT